MFEAAKNERWLEGENLRRFPLNRQTRDNSGCTRKEAWESGKSIFPFPAMSLKCAVLSSLLP